MRRPRNCCPGSAPVRQNDAAAALVELAGRSASNADDNSAALTFYERAVETYSRLDLLREAARASTGAAGALRGLGRLDQSRTLLREALAALEAVPDVAMVEALGELATLEAFAGHAAEADRLSAAALAEAQALDSPSVRLWELFTIRGIAHFMGNRYAQAVANVREAAVRAQAAQDGHGEGRALLNLSNALLHVDPRTAAEAAAAAAMHCRRVGDARILAVATENLIQALLLTGDWDEAERIWTNGEPQSRRNFPPFSALLLRALRGDQDGLDAVLSTSDTWFDTQDSQDLAAAAAGLAVAAALHEAHDDALVQAKRSLDHSGAIGLFGDSSRWAWPVAADAALALRDRSEVIGLLDWLESHPPGHVPLVLRAERLRIRARLLAADRDPEAGPLFESAVKAFRDFGSPYHVAVALLDQAEYLRVGDDDGAAAPLALEARAIAEKLGAKPLSVRAAAVNRSGQAADADAAVAG